MRIAREGMQCHGCALAGRRFTYPGGVEVDQAVFGAGTLASGIAFIGEGPGTAEVAQGVPLIGPTGQWFKALLSAAGLAFDDVYRTNALLCQGRGKGSELAGSDWTAIAQCRPSLHHEVRGLVEAGVRVLVPMGNAAMQSLMPWLKKTNPKTGKESAIGIRWARGYVWPYQHMEPLGQPPRCWIVPTYHPSPKNLKGEGSGWACAVSDIRKAMRIAANGPQPRQFVRHAGGPEGLHAFMRGGPRRIVCDVENTAAGELVCIGFCDGEQTIVLPVLQQYGTPNPHWLELKPLVAELLTWPTVFQNGVHDVTILAQNGLPVTQWVADTMLTMHACYPDQFKSLHHMGSLWGEGPPWKGEARGEGIAAEEMD